MDIILGGDDTLENKTNEQSEDQKKQSTTKTEEVKSEVVENISKKDDKGEDPRVIGGDYTPILS